MFEKNSLPFGLLAALNVPAIAFVLLYGLFELLELIGWMSDSGFRPKFRERTTSIIAIGINAILLNSFQEKRLFETVRGIVIATVILVALWVYLFGEYVL